MTVELSVIICTRNRAHLLRDAVASLAVQSAPVDTFEVLVVDNASTDATPIVVGELIEHFSTLRLQSIREDGLGLSHARNRGWREAKAPLVSFIDDDSLAPSEYVENLLDAFRAHPSAASVGGRILPRFEGPPPDWLTPWLHGYLSLQDFGPRARPYRRHEYAYGCNMAFRKEALERIGGFETQLTAAADDKDVAAKLISEAARRCYDPAVCVIHRISAERTTLEALRKIARRTGLMEYRRVRSSEIPRKWLEYQFKLAAAGILGAGYCFVGRFCAANALIRYRRGFIEGFNEGRRSLSS